MKIQLIKNGVILTYDRAVEGKKPTKQDQLVSQLDKYAVMVTKALVARFGEGESWKEPKKTKSKGPFYSRAEQSTFCVQEPKALTEALKACLSVEADADAKCPVALAQASGLGFYERAMPPVLAFAVLSRVSNGFTLAFAGQSCYYPSVEAMADAVAKLKPPVKPQGLLAPEGYPTAVGYAAEDFHTPIG